MRALLLGGALCLAVSCAAQAQIARGRYIVQHLGMCGDCHTLRDARGELIAKGAPLGCARSIRCPSPIERRTSPGCRPVGHRRSIS